MFTDLDIKRIKVYWLSEFADRFETWMAKRASIVSSDHCCSFTTYLVWPVEEADEGHLAISRQDGRLTLKTDWFPDEEFPLKVFTSQDDEVILMSHYERETIFVYLGK